MKMRFISILCALSVLGTEAIAQEKVNQTFKHSRVINGHSVDMLYRGTMDVLIRHRFGPLNGDAITLWGLDQAITRLAVEYAPRDNFNVGLGRSSGGFFDLFGKYRIYQQKENSIPISLVWVSLAGFDHLAYDQYKDDEGFQEQDANRFASSLSFSHQLLIGGKLHERFSLQLSPTYIHRNYVERDDLENDIFALGIGASYRISKHFTLVAEFYSPFTEADKINPFFEVEPAMALGVNIETSGHLFALHFSNSPALVAPQLLSQTIDPIDDLGVYRFGFNLSRKFKVHK